MKGACGWMDLPRETGKVQRIQSLIPTPQEFSRTVQVPGTEQETIQGCP